MEGGLELKTTDKMPIIIAATTIMPIIIFIFTNQTLVFLNINMPVKLEQNHIIPQGILA